MESIEWDIENARNWLLAQLIKHSPIVCKSSFDIIWGKNSHVMAEIGGNFVQREVWILAFAVAFWPVLLLRRAGRYWLVAFRGNLPQRPILLRAIAQSG